MKNDGELVAMSSKDQAFYVFDQVDVNPATFDFPDTVPAGATSVSFDVQSYNADANTRVIISARYSIDRITGTFTLHPLRETAFTCDAKTAKAGTIVNGTVTLEAPAPANGRLISISSSSPFISVPTTILIPAGQTTGTFQAKVVGTKKEVVTLQTGTPANSLYWKISLN